LTQSLHILPSNTTHILFWAQKKSSFSTNGIYLNTEIKKQSFFERIPATLQCSKKPLRREKQWYRAACMSKWQQHKARDYSLGKSYPASRCI